MEYIRILTCKAMTTDEIWVRILIYNDCGTEKFLNVFFPVVSFLLRKCLVTIITSDTRIDKEVQKIFLNGFTWTVWRDSYDFM